MSNQTCNNQAYKIVAINTRFIEQVRNQQIDDQNQPVEFSMAKGGEPCRDVLRPAKPNEKIILASYCPFTRAGPYKEYGPVYLLAEDIKSVRETPLSISQLVAEGYLGEVFVLKAYSFSQRIIDAKLAYPHSAEEIIEALFSNESVDFVMVRYAAFGCYSLRIERQVN